MIDQLRPIWWVASRELRDQLRDWRIIFPMIILTLFFPYLMNFTAYQVINFVEQYGTQLIGERIIPFLLMVVGFFPITVSLVVALEAFVGEKERGTIEPLLSSPIFDWQLYLGKLLAGTIVPLCASYIGITIYVIGLFWQRIPLPNNDILIQTICLTAVQAVLMVSAAMIISAQSTSVRAANLLASFVVIPVAILIQGESVLMFWGNNQVLWLAVLGVGVLAGLLVRVGLVHFQREALLGREIDMLNIGWVWKTFWQSFKGEARTPVEWYRYEIPRTLQRVWPAIVVIFVLALIGGFFGFTFTRDNIGYIQSGNTLEQFSQISEMIEESIRFDLPGLNLSVTTIWFHNVRASVIMLLLGIFSFGVLGILVYLTNMGIIGAVLGASELVGFSPMAVFITGILPHGIIELPAIMLSTAAILYIGAVLVTPNSHRSFGETFIASISDWLRIGLGLTIPMLLLAAAIEIWVTPLLILRALRGI